MTPGVSRSGLFHTGALYGVWCLRAANTLLELEGMPPPSKYFTSVTHHQKTHARTHIMLRRQHGGPCTSSRHAGCSSGARGGRRAAGLGGRSKRITGTPETNAPSKSQKGAQKMAPKIKKKTADTAVTTNSTDCANASAGAQTEAAATMSGCAFWALSLWSSDTFQHKERLGHVGRKRLPFDHHGFAEAGAVSNCLAP